MRCPFIMHLGLLEQAFESHDVPAVILHTPGPEKIVDVRELFIQRIRKGL